MIISPHLDFVRFLVMEDQKRRKHFFCFPLVIYSFGSHFTKHLKGLHVGLILWFFRKGHMLPPLLKANKGIWLAGEA